MEAAPGGGAVFGLFQGVGNGSVGSVETAGGRAVGVAVDVDAGGKTVTVCVDTTAIYRIDRLKSTVCIRGYFRYVGGPYIYGANL